MNTTQRGLVITLAVVLALVLAYIGARARGYGHGLETILVGVAGR